MIIVLAFQVVQVLKYIKLSYMLILSLKVKGLEYNVLHFQIISVTESVLLNACCNNWFTWDYKSHLTASDSITCKLQNLYYSWLLFVNFACYFDHMKKSICNLNQLHTINFRTEICTYLTVVHLYLQLYTVFILSAYRMFDILKLNLR